RGQWRRRHGNPGASGAKGLLRGRLAAGVVFSGGGFSPPRDSPGHDYDVIDLLTIIGVGFVLGIRHATDPDHVIAVTTIVSRQQSIRHAGLIGVLWGLGH